MKKKKNRVLLAFSQLVTCVIKGWWLVVDLEIIQRMINDIRLELVNYYQMMDGQGVLN